MTFFKTGYMKKKTAKAKNAGGSKIDSITKGNQLNSEIDADEAIHKQGFDTTNEKEDPDDLVHKQQVDEFDETEEEDLDDLVHPR